MNRARNHRRECTCFIHHVSLYAGVWKFVKGRTGREVPGRAAPGVLGVLAVPPPAVRGPFPPPKSPSADCPGRRSPARLLPLACGLPTLVVLRLPLPLGLR